MRSFSQLGNDIIAEFLLKKSEGVSYIDIGCLFPVSASNTYYFYRKGGRGLCIDPNPTVMERFMLERPRDIFFNAGVGREAAIMKYFMYANPVYNTFSERQANKVAQKARRGLEKCRLVETRQVRVLPLHNIIQESQFFDDLHSLDFMSIDVEGLEEDIITSIDFSEIRPKVICIEHIVDTATPYNIYESSIAKIFLDKGYYVAAFTGHDLFVRRTST